MVKLRQAEASHGKLVKLGKPWLVAIEIAVETAVGIVVEMSVGRGVELPWRAVGLPACCGAYHGVPRGFPWRCRGACGRACRGRGRTVVCDGKCHGLPRHDMGTAACCRGML